MKDLRNAAALAGILAFLFSSGCASTRHSLVERGKVTLEIVPSEEVVFSRVDVYQEKGKIAVSGNMRPRSTRHRSGSGHLDVMVAGRDGIVLERVSLPHKPLSARRKGPRELPFEVRLPGPIPEDAVVRIEYHPYEGGSGMSSCNADRK